MVFLLGLLILVLVCCWIGLCCISPAARDVTWGAPSNESGYFDE